MAKAKTTKVSLKDLLLLSGYPDIDVALLIPCENCKGQGSYPMHLSGGPYGFDQSWIEQCPHCFKEYGKPTGKRLVKVPLMELVSFIREHH